VAHARPHRAPRSRSPPRDVLLRLLRRGDVPQRPFDQRWRARLAPRPHRPDRRGRKIRGESFWRAPHVFSDQRDIHLKPHHLDGLRRTRTEDLGGPELPQVERAGDHDDRGCAALPHAHAQPLRPHRSDPAGKSTGKKAHRGWPSGPCRDHELNLRRTHLQRGPRARGRRRCAGSNPFRRGMVWLCPLPSALPRTLCHAGKS